MIAWFPVKCRWGDCGLEAKIGGDIGNAGWELIGYITKKWYCPEHGLIKWQKINAMREQYATPQPTEAKAEVKSDLDELMAMV